MSKKHGYFASPATSQSDDDEAFALAQIMPFQLGCRGTASVRVAFQALRKGMPGCWRHRGPVKPLSSWLEVSAL